MTQFSVPSAWKAAWHSQGSRNGKASGEDGQCKVAVFPGKSVLLVHPGLLATHTPIAALPACPFPSEVWPREMPAGSRGLEKRQAGVNAVATTAGAVQTQSSVRRPDAAVPGRGLLARLAGVWWLRMWIAGGPPPVSHRWEGLPVSRLCANHVVTADPPLSFEGAGLWDAPGRP